MEQPKVTTPEHAEAPKRTPAEIADLMAGRVLPTPPEEDQVMWSPELKVNLAKRRNHSPYLAY